MDAVNLFEPAAPVKPFIAVGAIRRYPPGKGVRRHGKLGQFPDDVQRADSRLLRHLVTKADPVVERAEPDAHHGAGLPAAGADHEFVVVIADVPVLSPGLFPGRVPAHPFGLVEKGHLLVEAVPPLEQQAQARAPNDFLPPIVDDVPQAAVLDGDVDLDIAVGREQSFACRLLRKTRAHDAGRRPTQRDAQRNAEQFRHAHIQSSVDLNVTSTSSRRRGGGRSSPSPRPGPTDRTRRRSARRRASFIAVATPAFTATDLRRGPAPPRQHLTCCPISATVGHLA